LALTGKLYCYDASRREREEGEREEKERKRSKERFALAIVPFRDKLYTPILYVLMVFYKFFRQIDNK